VTSAVPTRWPVKRLLLVLGLAATAYALVLLLWGDGHAVSLSVLWTSTGLQAAGLCLLSYLLRGLRWRLWMAHYGRHFGWVEGLRLYLSGYAFTPTPGNVGEAMRGLMLAQKPLPLLQSLAIFGAERLADLLCLLLLCAPALLWLLKHSALDHMNGVMVALVAATFLVGTVLAVVVWRNRQRLLQRFAWLQDAWACLSVRPLVWFGLTLTAWAAQGIAVWLICRALEVHMLPLTAIGFYAVAMVAGALSALPAGLGGMELVLAGLLVAQSASTAEALTITVVTRLLTLWLAVAIGVAALLYSALIRKDIRF
jgi:glycosyltransferase 2 family protein